MPPVSSGCGCSSEKAKPEFPPVLVDGVEIEPERIAQETQNHPTPDPAEAWREAAKALVVRELLLREARRRDLAPDPRKGRFANVLSIEPSPSGDLIAGMTGNGRDRQYDIVLI